MAKKLISRALMNKQARRTLQINGINQIELQLSCTPTSITLSGKLLNTNGKDLYLKQVEKLSKDLRALPGVKDLYSDLENWEISLSGISTKNRKNEKNKTKHQKDDSSDGFDPLGDL